MLTVLSALDMGATLLIERDLPEAAVADSAVA